MRRPRNLSGCFFRYKNPETGRYENWCFEDLPKEERERQIEPRSREWLISMVHILADTVVKLGDTFDIAMGGDDEKDETIAGGNDERKKD